MVVKQGLHSASQEMRNFSESTVANFCSKEITASKQHLDLESNFFEEGGGGEIEAGGAGGVDLHWHTGSLLHSLWF